MTLTRTGPAWTTLGGTASFATGSGGATIVVVGVASEAASSARPPSRDNTPATITTPTSAPPIEPSVSALIFGAGDAVFAFGVNVSLKRGTDAVGCVSVRSIGGRCDVD